MRLPALLLALPWIPLAADPLPGAWEKFPAAAHATAWSVNDFRTGMVSAAQWISAETGFIARPLNGVPGTPCGIWFFTGSEDGSGVMTGNFHAAKIRGMRLRYFATSEELGELDCAIYALGPAGSTFYYSESVLGSDLSPGAEWRDAEFLFNVNWYYVQDGSYRATPVTPQMLATVSEIGFRFIPKNGLTTTTSAGIDDIVLIPTVEAPALVPGSAGADFTLDFTPRPGTSCTIQKSAAEGLAGWLPVAGQERITGSRLFQTPRSGAKAFYRVTAQEHLTPVTSP